MASKHSLQALYDYGQQHIEHARTLQNSIKKLQSTKKDLEIKQQQQNLHQLLDNLSKHLQNFQKKVTSVQNENDLSFGSEDNDSGAGVDKQDQRHAHEDSGKKRLAGTEDQEISYHLKARQMPHINKQNNNLKAEIMLMKRRNELRAERKERQINYNKDTNLSAVTTLRAIQLYERRAKAAEARANDLQAQLDEVQCHKGSENVRASSKSAEPDISRSFLGPNNRVNDVIKKNEILVEENGDQQREIQRLKRDNAELVKKVKIAEQDQHQIMSSLSTSEMARKDLQTRLQKQKAQHDRLSRSLTRQSSDWIEARKQQNQVEEDWRWKNVGHAAQHGNYERTYSHPVARNTDRPRYMYPVEKYAEPCAA